MSAGCCEDKSTEVLRLRGQHAHVLKIVLAINGAMFLLEFAAGLWTRSTALLADSLDMLGDASVYVFSLCVIGRGRLWEARAAFFKGTLMLAFGLFVAGEAIRKAIGGLVPMAEGMAAVGMAALAANAACMILLLQHRTADLNMRSTWLCSRNDVIANAGVLLAAGAVAVFDSRWPDLLAGGVIGTLFLSSAISVLRESIAGLRVARVSH